MRVSWRAVTVSERSFHCMERSYTAVAEFGELKVFRNTRTLACSPPKAWGCGFGRMIVQPKTDQTFDEAAQLMAKELHDDYRARGGAV